MKRRSLPTRNSRFNEPSSDENLGLVSWLENTRIVLPLKGVDCCFSVCGGVASVQVDQVFLQENTSPLNCLYSFPLPAGAAVYKCEMQVNGRIIAAKVEEEQKAREIAKKKAAGGHRTALVEVERDNLFTLSLGNVQPQDIVIVRLSFFQAVEQLGDVRSIRVPFSPGVRYVPGKRLVRDNRGIGTADDTDQVPDASRITPPRIDALHPDAASIFVEGTILKESGVELAASSPSHLLRVTEEEDRYVISLADSGDVPNRDLVVHWTENAQQAERRSAWITTNQNAGQDYALVELRAPDAPAGADTFEQDVYFLIDQSGSMQGMKWEKAAQAFRSFLSVLGSGDRVFATLFESSFRDIAEKPLAPETLLGDGGVQSMESLGTLGGTELLPALEHILATIEKHSSDRPVSLVLITDGQVGNESEVLETLREHPDLRVHTFGIDTAVNDAFLEGMASQQRGTCCLRTPGDDIAGAVKELGAMIGKPVLRSLKVHGSWEATTDGLPDLFAGQVVTILLRRPGKDSASGSRTECLHIKGLRPGGNPMIYRIAAHRTDEPAIPLLWAKKRIAALQAEGDRASAIGIAKAHNILCKGAAFIAWDEAEKVAVAGPEATLYQPSFKLHAASLFAAPGVMLAQVSRFHDGDEPRFERRLRDNGFDEFHTPTELCNLFEEAGVPSLTDDAEVLAELSRWVDEKRSLRSERLALARDTLGLLRHLLFSRDKLKHVLHDTRDLLGQICDAINPEKISLSRAPDTAPLRHASELLERTAREQAAFDRVSHEFIARLKEFPRQVRDSLLAAVEKMPTLR